MSRSPSSTPRLYYGWVVLACALCATFARQGAAVATLSVFIAPMVAEFDWSRAAMSGAVSAGSVLAAVFGPLTGRLVDRYGARVMLSVAALVMALCAFGLSATTSLLGFYVLFSLARLVFAGPFELGLSTAVANWFVRRRAEAMSYVSVGIGVSLAVMPLIAHWASSAGGWRAGWAAVGVAVLVVGTLPVALAMRRRPEDLGLLPDGDAEPAQRAKLSTSAAEPEHTVGTMLRTPTAWLLMGYTALVFPVQAGMSLHQAPHLIDIGLPVGVAATSVAVFSLSTAAGSLLCGRVGLQIPIRYRLAFSAALIAIAAVGLSVTATSAAAWTASAVFGLGIGGLLTLMPVAWADYYGRRNYGAIRGVTLPAMVLAQAVGPLLGGWLYDVEGSYAVALAVFAALPACASVLVLFARPPVAR